MKFALIALTAGFALSAGVAMAMPRVDVTPSSSVVLVQKKDKEDKAANSSAAGKKAATNQQRETRGNKGGETRGADRAGQVKGMNQDKKTQ
jgi:hypothetical protein